MSAANIEGEVSALWLGINISLGLSSVRALLAVGVIRLTLRCSRRNVEGRIS